MRSRPLRRGILGYLRDDPSAWCQLCQHETLEDVRHVLGWCDSEPYRSIRSKWYEEVQSEARDLAPELWEAIEAGLRCRDGVLVAVGCKSVEAWHAATGKIPILWTEAAMGAGVGRSEYEKWLRWYGKKIRNGLWWPLLKVRRLLRAGLADAHGGDDGDLAGSEDSADEDADVVMTGT